MDFFNDRSRYFARDSSKISPKPASGIFSEIHISKSLPEFLLRFPFRVSSLISPGIFFFSNPLKDQKIRILQTNLPGILLGTIFSISFYFWISNNANLHTGSKNCCEYSFRNYIVQHFSRDYFKSSSREFSKDSSSDSSKNFLLNIFQRDFSRPSFEDFSLEFSSPRCVYRFSRNTFMNSSKNLSRDFQIQNFSKNFLLNILWDFIPVFLHGFLHGLLLGIGPRSFKDSRTEFFQ